MSDAPAEKWPEDLGKRINELVGSFGLDASTKFTYSWDHGYETFFLQTDGSGSMEYGGSFHPCDGLCIGNPCEYCGSVTDYQDFIDDMGAPA